MPKIIFIFSLFSLFVLPLACPGNGAAEDANSANVSVREDLGLTQEELDFLRENPVIRVGNEEDWAPFDFSRHGKPSGYAIDHLELLGRKLGISFEYINGYTWAELLKLFKNNEIDLLPSLWISESRKDYMLFTEPFLELPYILVTKKDSPEISDFQDLQGKTVAVPKSYKQEEVLENDYPEIDLYRVKGVLDGLKAVNYGRADAYIGYRGTVDYLIATRFLTDLEIKGEIEVPQLGPQGLYIAVQKDMAPLRSALQKAMDQVPNQEKVRLARKWITIDRSPAPSLTDKEKKFLEDNPVLRVDSMSWWPPFNFRENEKPKGFSIDYMRLLAEKLDIDLQFVTADSWRDYLSMLQNRDLDILCDVVETTERGEYIDFTRPYFMVFTGIVTKKESNDFRDLDSLAGKKVAVPEGFYHEEILRKQYPKIDVVTRKNTLECLKSVSSGRTAAALAEKPVFDYLINKHFLMDLQSVPVLDNPHFENTPVSMGVKKGQTTLRNILQKTMDVVTEEEAVKLKAKWLGTETERDLGSGIAFSAEERQYLAKNKDVHLCVQPEQMPLEGMDENGHYRGIIADIASLLGERSGIDFIPVPAESREQCARKVTSGECSAVSDLSKNPDTAEDFLFTKPYMHSTRVIVVPDRESYIPDMASLQGKKVSVIRNDPVIEYINSNHPDIEIVLAENTEQLLRYIDQGQVDAGIGGLQITGYKIQELGLYSLKITGQTPFKRFFRMGVSRDEPRLHSILNKAIDSVSERDINRIKQNWLSVKYEPGFDYQLIWKITALAAAIFVGILLWNRKLSRLNREIARAHEELGEKNKELERLSTTDKLTGTCNRLRLEEVLDKECERSRRYGEPLSIILADIDDFKDVNDLHGHQRGDQVLQEVAACLCTNIRRSDTAGRWGGEEFLIVCPETDSSGAAALAEKLRERVEDLDLQEVSGVTCSFGVVEIRKNESSDSLMSRVDRLLYKAKGRGKNRVVCAA
ncbi:MAG: transporter substrate-binding domain-containing protein [Desulfonatronovibrionaceae bacterium]